MQTGVWRCCDRACGRSREPWSVMSRTHMCVSEARGPGSRFRLVVFVSVVSHDADMCIANACAASTIGCMSSRALTHTHMRMARASVRACALQKQGTRGRASGCLIAHAAFGLMFECVTSHRCVLQTQTCVCCGSGCCYDLAACRFFARKHTYTHAHICGRKQRSQARVSVCTHTCVLQKQGIRGHSSSCLDCVLIAHARSRPCVAEAMGLSRAEATMSQAALMFVHLLSRGGVFQC